jgi:hypothetical protein
MHAVEECGGKTAGGCARGLKRAAAEGGTGQAGQNLGGMAGDGCAARDRERRPWTADGGGDEDHGESPQPTARAAWAQPGRSPRSLVGRGNLIKDVGNVAHEGALADGGNGRKRMEGEAPSKGILGLHAAVGETTLR